MFDLSGRCALVTGASGGLGGAIARALHGQGARVGLSGTREDALAVLASELGDRADTLPCDLGDPSAVADLIGRAETAMGQVDILVNNAGVTRDGLAMRMKDADWARVIEINLTVAFRLSRAALRGMMRRRWGRIISISSVVGIAGNPGQANYAASKAGLIGMGKSLAAEVATRGITVNSVAPGMIDTAMTQALDEKQIKRVLAAIPTGRLGAPDDIAGAVVYLASDAGAYVTGHTLNVNGGMVMT